MHRTIRAVRQKAGQDRSFLHASTIATEITRIAILSSVSDVRTAVRYGGTMLRGSRTTPSSTSWTPPLPDQPINRLSHLRVPMVRPFPPV